MAGWHHRLDGHGFEQTLEMAWWEAQRILASCNPWSCKESDMTQRLIISLFVKYFFVPVATLTIVFLIFLLIVVANILKR